MTTRALTLLLLTATVAWADPGKARADCDALKGKWTELPGGLSGCRVKNQNEGEWTRVLPGGQVLERTVWKSGKRDGPSVKYFEHCQVMERGEWKDGRRTGPWVFWNEEGKKVREGSFVDGRESGVWVLYHRDTGLKRLEGPYVRGFAEGTFTEYLPRGEKWREVLFKAGRRVGEGPAACEARGGEWEVDFKERKEGCVVDSRDEGQWLGYDGNGKLRWRGTYKKGRLDGLYEEFHPTGERLRRGKYDDGIPAGRHEWRAVDGTLYGVSTILHGSGEWTVFHPNGRVAEQGAFENGCPVGPWRTSTEEGRVMVEENYEGCRREGPYVWFHTNGQRRLVGQYREGRAVGEWKAFYSNGDPDWVGHYEDGDRSGQWRFWRWGKQLKAEGPMEGDIPNGVWTEYHPTGKASETGMRVGTANQGDWKTFWSTGEAWRDVAYVDGQDQADAAKECTRMKGAWTADGEKRTLGCLVCRAREDDSLELVPMGVWTFWHPSGGMEKQGTLVEGRLEGAWKYFHDNGSVMMEGTFDGGVEAGLWRGSWRTGQPRFEGAYVEGKPDGVWTSWLADGGVLSVGRYAKGEKVGEWKYEKNGKLVVETQAERDQRKKPLSDAGVPDGGVDAGP
jgi:antitoxin component YwqK of YwqJK toxin-antitoxin module